MNKAEIPQIDVVGGKDANNRNHERKARFNPTATFYVE
jgi:hypothetical protein